MVLDRLSMNANPVIKKHQISGFELVGISSYSFILNYLENPAGGKGHSAPALIA